MAICLRFNQSLTVYLIEASFDTLANRADPDQAALVSCLIRLFSVCLWKHDNNVPDPTLVDLTSTFYLCLSTNIKINLYNYL